MTDEPTTPKKRFMTDREVAHGMGLLTEHLRRMGDGFAYAPGWNDQAIAAEVGCSLANAIGLRERNFGKLSKGDAAIDPRVDHLLERVAHITAAHNEFVNDVTVWLNKSRKSDDEFDPVPYHIEVTK